MTTSKKKEKTDANEQTKFSNNYGLTKGVILELKFKIKQETSILE
ncbi:32080_t:CDS:2 [Gigaspora margarita]|uniref:32080_t:CDS:1 n=1 Tax=Gigaspora margarita TaxID=4874 RepID=A0ABN7UM43_GIGMA|nr:32080_t:CDS:2 [Gigaspora margarita]